MYFFFTDAFASFGSYVFGGGYSEQSDFPPAGGDSGDLEFHRDHFGSMPPRGASHMSSGPMDQSIMTFHIYGFTQKACDDVKLIIN